VSPEWLVPIPDEVSYEQAAVATDAGLTAYHALTARGHVKPGDKVGIIGAGGVGHLGIQYALALGASVYVAEVNDAQREASAGYAYSKWAKSILEFASENLDVIIDYAGFGITTSEALQAVKFGGRVVLVGIGVPEFTVSTMLVGKEAELVGSLNGTKDDLEQVLAILAAGKASAHTESINFYDIPAGLKRLAAGDVRGRLVAEIPDE
jgi:D-arabinose 1-dehydrogenase-like Zn-dependent alcohol dehydrogenase